MNQEPKINYSELSQEIASEGKTVSVEIYHLEGFREWQLEVVDEFGNSTVWDDSFEKDSEALAEVHRTIQADGIEFLIGPEGDEKRKEWL